MKAGNYRHLVTIEHCVEEANDYGELIKAWRTYATVNASVEPLVGNESFAAMQVGADLTHRVKARYLPGVVPQMRVKFSGRTLNIMSATNDGERSRELVMMCKELV